MDSLWRSQAGGLIKELRVTRPRMWRKHGGMPARYRLVTTPFLPGLMKVLANVDLTASLPKLNLIRERTNQIDSSTVFGMNLLAADRAEDL